LNITSLIAGAWWEPTPEAGLGNLSFVINQLSLVIGGSASRNYFLLMSRRRRIRK
jgi:hypothetical protein